jgi:hypothetical protein
MKKSILYLLIGFFSAVIVTEVFLHLMPVVSTGVGFLPVNAANPVLRSKPSEQFIYSKGWNFRLKQQNTFNNNGFTAAIPFVKNQPNVLLIGDSWVEAQATNISQNLGAELSKRLKTSVYPLGMSGARVTDYLALAKWGIDKYQPKALIFLLSGGDLDETTQILRGGYNFKSQVGNDCELIRQETKEHSLLAKMITSTQLFRYLFNNLLLANNIQKPATTIQPESLTLLKQQTRSYASKCFVNQLTKISTERKVLVVFHHRKGDDDLQPLVDVLTEAKIPVMNLTNILNSSVVKTGLRIDNLPTDAHWNALGQSIAADYLAPVISDLLASRSKIPNSNQ